MKHKEKFIGFWGEFKKFAIKGNVIDLAVGVIIGGAFGKITASFVNDIVMPLIGLLLGGVNFTGLSITLPSIFPDKEPAVLAYGNFIGVVLDFLIIAFFVFLFVKFINSLRKKEPTPPPPPPPEPTEEVLLLREILKTLQDK